MNVFHAYLEAAGWTVRREVEFCDLVGERDGARVYVEAKGRTEATGTDADTMYGQLLRRMPLADDPRARFAVVVPERAVGAALRVSPRERELLRIDVYAVSDEGDVRGPISEA